jgi:hypothetical protein
MIVEITPYTFTASVPSLWTLWYKEEDEVYFNTLLLTFTQLKLFLEKYGYETNDIELLNKFGICTKNIQHNPSLK